MNSRHSQQGPQKAPLGGAKLLLRGPSSFLACCHKPVLAPRGSQALCDSFLTDLSALLPTLGSQVPCRSERLGRLHTHNTQPPCQVASRTASGYCHRSTGSLWSTAHRYPQPGPKTHKEDATSWPRGGSDRQRGRARGEAVAVSCFAGSAPTMGGPDKGAEHVRGPGHLAGLDHMPGFVQTTTVWVYI